MDNKELDKTDNDHLVEDQSAVLTTTNADGMDIDQPEEKQDEEHEQEQKPKKFQVKKWTAVAFWSWDIDVENCAICRNHIMEPCIQCQPTAMSDTNKECVAAWGTCNHVFHLHCINKWLQTRNACPLDNQPWKFAKYGR
ncbi:probable RING-box protein HRT1 [Saccharomycodes ludwigii]|uniref:Probable RING-box protein HRT1 n=1 Tax=Saccharomycodes ludwigii TaxID=36035 RepID=A0A376B4T7_9ASCO|nr:hypothetical protein SCDLUD_005007 [Saccharomycodes ludwigii]KAH3898684.1 hypothetical protein SCDLUD_005007 [Saccharomycodes ludwigii]SSD59707.1 probable RING-box protein HRT1 [Saccharomycodes ludwigii]